MSDPKTLAEELYELMNDREIADALRKSGIKVTQATINRIRCGQIKRTSFDIGAGLLHLHNENFLQKSA